MYEAVFSLEVFIHWSSITTKNNVKYLLKFLHFPPQSIEKDAKKTDRVFCGGKSCMFRYQVEAFLNHLDRLPLYLVVLEDIGNDSRYLGTITVPLVRIRGAMRDEMQVTGLRKPFVNGEKGEFNIYDLMGLSIGSAAVSYRIYCLGNLALPHIPPTDVTTGTPGALTSSDPKWNREAGERDELKVEDEENSNVVPIDEKISVSVPCQTERPMKLENIVLDEQPKLVLVNTNVQTEHEKTDNCDELFARKNPPNLFYRRTQAIGFQQAVQDADVVIDDLEKKLNEKVTDEEPEQNKQIFASMDGDFDNFPILEALMKEIELIRLRRPRDRAGIKFEYDEKVTQTSPKIKKVQEKVVAMNNYNNSLPVGTDRPRSGMLHQSSANAKHSHRRLCELKVCDRVPAQTSWIRTSSVPTPGRRSKSKLEYGLTSSYLARLRNSNPSLFESLPLSNCYLEKSLDHEAHATSRMNKRGKERTDSRICKKFQKGTCKHKSKSIDNNAGKQKKDSTIGKSQKVEANDLKEDRSKEKNVSVGQGKTVLELEVPSQNADLMNDSFERLISSPVYMNHSFDQTVDVKLEDIDERLGKIDSEVNIDSESPYKQPVDPAETVVDNLEANIAPVSNGLLHTLENNSFRSQSSEEDGDMNGPNVSHSSKSLDGIAKNGSTVTIGNIVFPVQRSYSDDFDQESENGDLSPLSPLAKEKVEQIILSPTTSIAHNDKEGVKDDQSLASSESYSSPSRTGYRPTFARR